MVCGTTFTLLLSPFFELKRQAASIVKTQFEDAGFDRHVAFLPVVDPIDKWPELVAISRDFILVDKGFPAFQTLNLTELF